MIFINQFKLCAPTPVGTAGGVGVTAEDLESVFDGVARAGHDACVVVKGVYPTGFVLFERCVIAESEHAMLWFTFNGALIEMDGEASFQY